MKIKINSIFENIFVILIVIFITSNALINYIIPSIFLRYLLPFILLVYIIYISLKKDNYKNVSILGLLIFMMMLVFLIGNKSLIVSYIPSMFFIIFLIFNICSEEKNEMANKIINISYYIYIFYAICTVVFMFTPNFYLNKVVPLFPQTQNRLINWYNNGCMAGLTQHYSYNAMFISSGLIICFSKIFSGETKKKSLSFIIFIFLCIALLLTGKRAHILFSFLAMYLTYYVSQDNNKIGRVFKIIISLFIVLVIFSITLKFVPSLGVFIDRFNYSLSKGDITENRVLFWNLAIDKIKSNPLIGIGWNNYQYLALEVLNYKAHTHNVFLQLLCETGILGFIIYLIWFMKSLMYTIQCYKKYVHYKMKNIKIKKLLTFSLCFQIFFIFYCFTGNTLYDIEMFVPYFISCSIGIYYTILFRKELNNEK